MRGERLEHLGLAQELLVALGGLGRLLDAAVDHLQIGHDELQIDRADVAQRVDRLVLAGVMFSSSKQRTTWTMAAVRRIFSRNLLPRPAPLLAPLTRPAMSTNSITAGVFLSGLYISASLSSRASGTATTPTLGSMVQNG